MPETILITGGAGFIGSHLADELLAQGYRVRVLDSLNPQVHGEAGERPSYLSPDVDLQVGDVRDAAAVKKALEGVDRVVHFAAAVGVGQSMYEIARYSDINVMGTATLLEALIERPVAGLVVASSMSIYGEGLYADADGNPVEVGERPLAQLKAAQWDPVGSDGGTLVPIPTPESKTPSLSSVYALGKYDQERLCLMTGRAYGIPTTALRLFNVFGTRQALSNPYTGVLAIFGSRLLNGNRPLVFEDGRQLRDFVSVKDVARATRLALETPAAAGLAMNIGSGRAYSVLDVAALVAGALGRPDLTPEIAGTSRVGDIRHCFADISLAREVLGYEPRTPLEEGIGELGEWIAAQTADDRVDRAREELAARGLTV